MGNNPGCGIVIEALEFNQRAFAHIVENLVKPNLPILTFHQNGYKRSPQETLCFYHVDHCVLLSYERNIYMRVIMKNPDLVPN
jgi:hypothetical protein